MRFAFTDDQLAFRDAVRDLLAKECPPEVVRAAWPDGTDAHGARKGEGARRRARWPRSGPHLAEMGVLGIARARGRRRPRAWPSSTGCSLAEETGYAALPHPFVETACVVAPLLDDTGDPHGVLAALLDGAGQARRRPARPLRSCRWGDAGRPTWSASTATDGGDAGLGGAPDRGRPGRRRPADAAPHPGRRRSTPAAASCARCVAVRRRLRHGRRSPSGPSTGARSAPPRSSSASAAACST